MKNSDGFVLGGILTIIAGGMTALGLYLEDRIKIIDYTDKLPNNPNGAYYVKRDPKKITQAVVHHAAAPSSWTPERINELHIKERGWQRIGYRALIYPDGRVYIVNKPETLSYHISGENTISFGYCLVINGEETAPTPLQYAALVQQIKNDQNILGHKFKAIIGHGEGKGQSTRCPGKLTDMEMIRGAFGLSKNKVA